VRSGPREPPAAAAGFIASAEDAPVILRTRDDGFTAPDLPYNGRCSLRSGPREPPGAAGLVADVNDAPVIPSTNDDGFQTPDPTRRSAGVAEFGPRAPPGTAWFLSVLTKAPVMLSTRNDGFPGPDLTCGSVCVAAFGPRVPPAAAWFRAAVTSAPVILRRIDEGSATRALWSASAGGPSESAAGITRVRCGTARLSRERATDATLRAGSSSRADPLSRPSASAVCRRSADWRDSSAAATRMSFVPAGLRRNVRECSALRMGLAESRVRACWMTRAGMNCENLPAKAVVTLPAPPSARRGSTTGSAPRMRRRTRGRVSAVTNLPLI